MNAPDLIVLDTNVVFDCWVFDDPRCRPLAQALSARSVRWIATAAMRDELVHTLGRGRLDARWPRDGAVAAWDALAELRPEPAPTRLVCSDADDQKFIDLAVVAGAGWLLTRDRALLKLRRRAASHGVTVAPPEQWPAPAAG